MHVNSIAVDGTPSTVVSEGVSKYGTELTLIKHKSTVIVITMTSIQ
jgi:hypothetical protein